MDTSLFFDNRFKREVAAAAILRWPITWAHLIIISGSGWDNTWTKFLLIYKRYRRYRIYQGKRSINCRINNKYNDNDRNRNQLTFSSSDNSIVLMEFNAAEITSLSESNNASANTRATTRFLLSLFAPSPVLNNLSSDKIAFCLTSLNWCLNVSTLEETNAFCSISLNIQMKEEEKEDYYRRALRLLISIIDISLSIYIYMYIYLYL